MSEKSITGLRTVGVPVTDQDHAVEFYGELLGLDKRMDDFVEQIGGRWIELTPASSATRSPWSPPGRAYPRASRPVPT